MTKDDWITTMVAGVGSSMKEARYAHATAKKNNNPFEITFYNEAKALGSCKVDFSEIGNDFTDIKALDKDRSTYIILSPIDLSTKDDDFGERVSFMNSYFSGRLTDLLTELVSKYDQNAMSWIANEEQAPNVVLYIPNKFPKKDSFEIAHRLITDFYLNQFKAQENNVKPYEKDPQSVDLHLQ